MNSFILLGSIQCLILSVFVFSKKGKTSADALLLSLLVFFTILFGFIYYTQEFNKTNLTTYLLNSGLLISALFAAYIQKLLDRKPGFNSFYLIHFIPFVFTSVFMFVYYLIASHSETSITSFYVFVHKYKWIHDSYRYINLCIGPGYLLFFLYIFRKRRFNVGQVFSSDEKEQFSWVKHLIVLSLLLWFVTAVLSKIVIHFWFPKFLQGYELAWGLSALLFVYMAYKGFKHKSIFFDLPQEKNSSVNENDIETETKRPQKYEKSGLKEKDFELYGKRINDYIETKKPYLNSQLTIYELASALEMPPYQLSQILNEYYKQNFFDFINRFRIEEFKKRALQQENKNYSIQAIAFDCGFNSKSTFYRIFKEQTQLTPSQFLEQSKKSY